MAEVAPPAAGPPTARRQFELQRTVDLPAGALPVWRAIATGAGQQAWRFPADDETPREVGDTLAGYRVVVWEPPHRLGLRAETGDDWFEAVEYVVDGRDGDTSALDYRHSGVMVDDWEAEYDSLDQHTDFALHTLAEYLAHFPGREAIYIGAQSSASLDVPEAFGLVRRALGLPDDALEGDPIHIEVLGAAPIDGVIDYLRPQFVGVRSGVGLYRFFGRDAFGQPIALGHHLFDPRVDQLETSAWGAWLDSLFVPT